MKVHERYNTTHGLVVALLHQHLLSSRLLARKQAPTQQGGVAGKCSGRGLSVLVCTGWPALVAYLAAVGWLCD